MDMCLQCRQITERDVMYWVIFQYWGFFKYSWINLNWMLLWIAQQPVGKDEWRNLSSFKLLLWITQQPLGDNCLDFPFSSIRQHVMIVDIFILFIHLLLNCYDKKAAKTNLNFVVYSCIVELCSWYCIGFTHIRRYLNLSTILLHLSNGCSWLYICCTHTCI
jgi:hypothetical protein